MEDLEALCIEETQPGACVLPVRARPGAKQSGACGVHAGALRVALRAPAEDGRATEELLRWLGERLGLRARDLELASGARSRATRVRVPLSGAEVRRRLASASA